MTAAVSYVSGQLAKQSKPVGYGDLLMTLTGENKEEIGKTVAFMGREKTVIGGDLATFTNHLQNPMYLSYLMNSPYAIQQKALLGTGDIIVHISCEKLASILVPLPPLSAQVRIVAEIEALFGIVEKM
jgi:type I restriction enzyme S subunit